MRLFVAIPCPTPWHERLDMLCGALRSVRWLPHASRHLTLRFLGERNADRLDDYRSALDAIGWEPFALETVECMPLPGGRKPKVLALGLQVSERFTYLYESIGAALVKIGEEPEKRRFRPHITLGRVSRRASSRELADWLQSAAAPLLPAAEVTQFRLYRSILHPDGASYEELGRFGG